MAWRPVMSSWPSRSECAVNTTSTAASPASRSRVSTAVWETVAVVTAFCSTTRVRTSCAHCSCSARKSPVEAAASCSSESSTSRWSKLNALMITCAAVSATSSRSCATWCADRAWRYRVPPTPRTASPATNTTTATTAIQTGTPARVRSVAAGAGSSSVGCELMAATVPDERPDG